MAERTITKTKNLLFKLLKEKNLTIDKIVVFGSRANDTAKIDSDIDIAIISKEFRNRSIYKRVVMARGIHSAVIEKINKPIDLLFYSDTEWNGSSLMVDIAKNNGIIFTN